MEKQHKVYIFTDSDTGNKSVLASKRGIGYFCQDVNAYIVQDNLTLKEATALAHQLFFLLDTEYLNQEEEIDPYDEPEYNYEG